MGELQDPDILGIYRFCLSRWDCSGAIVWKQPALDFVYRDLSGCTPRFVASILHKHVQGGGKIREKREDREEWMADEFHYDLVFEINGRRIYAETLLLREQEPIDSAIYIVSMHYDH
jgi:hypothetical protein